MQICSKCVLDENYPGIHFDDDGVCNFCRMEKPLDFQEKKIGEYEDKFKQLIAEHSGKAAYDAIVAYSGGKDSTYTMHLLKEKYGLNVLAFTMDNWFFSDRAQENIGNVVKAMGVDHINFRPAFDVYRKVINASAHNDLYSIKAMQRASSICTSCISIVRFLCFQVAIEKAIPFVVFGMSPGQAPLATSVVKTNATIMKQSQAATYDALRAHVGDSIKSYFLNDIHFAQTERFPYSINPLAFNPYNEHDIYDLIAQYKWSKPKDTDANSTNCLLNAYANKVHHDRYHVNPYAYEIAGLVRSGAITREEGLQRLKEALPSVQVEFVEKRLTTAG